MLDPSHLRSWWWHRQGLDGSLAGCSASEVLEHAGWARSVGGAGPYLTLFARAGIDRTQADQALADQSIHELPAARSCTYVVPQSEFALALSVGREFDDGDFRAAQKLGVTDKEIRELCAGVIKALHNGPMDPNAIRTATGKLSRSLGEEGKKKGVTTTLPLALGRLQSQGVVRRIPVDGRLDQQRYAYALWQPNPLAGYKLTTDEAYIALARNYFRWIGPATPQEFQWFSGLGVKRTQVILSCLSLEPCQEGSNRLLLSDDVNKFRKFKTLNKPQYALVSSLDSLFVSRRNIADLTEPQDLGRSVMADSKLAELGRLSDLPSHAILDRGRLIGLWEFDVDTQRIVTGLFVPADRALNKLLQRTEAFICEQLGDMRAFSLDSPKSRQSRIQNLNAFTA